MLFGSSDPFDILFDTMFGLCGSIFGVWDCFLCAVVKSEDELCNEDVLCNCVMLKVKGMQRLGTEAIRTQLQPSNAKR